ncbi:DNA polymerase III PolC-type [anaerobic digester metagenome]
MWILLILSAIVLIIILTNTKKDNSKPIDNKVTYRVIGPRPNTKNEFAFYKFVSETHEILLKPWYQDMLKRGFVFKPEYIEAIETKLSKGSFNNPLNFIDYWGKKFDYIAIDFETANNERISACALGLAFVKDDTIVNSEFYYIKPPDGTVFSSRNIDIHGIKEEDVEYSSTFDELWNSELNHFFNENILVLHNASMDASVLRNLLEFYQVSDYNINYTCTMNVAKKMHYPARLSELCKKFNIEIERQHDPKSDAIACAEIASKFIELGINLRDYSKPIRAK